MRERIAEEERISKTMSQEAEVPDVAKSEVIKQVK